ncbi:MAG: family 10 glycosylhydrolase [Verrucomicrobiales bacterium]|nr:family 10 glycosylhydrolase [Verrucomicrobiales bacterium]
MKPFLFFLLLLSTAFSQNLPPDPPREFRAAWVATVWNIDWPSKPGLPASTQKSQLLAILDRAASLNLNAVILQVRPAGDALYQTDLEPWSSVLSGTEGRSPGYDPLAFAVAEAHRRGLELHAWFNPFRPATAAGKSHPSNHVTRRFPDAVRTYRKKPWMDPGDPRVRAHTIKVITDVARRYDVDGVHIDDYFYPYPSAGQKTDFPDSATYARYGRGKNRDAWRRSNTDTFVRDLYSAIKKTRPHVKFGISPFGIWRPGNPRGIEAKLDSFAHIHADSRRWLNEGWCDYFSPQLYWRIEPRKQSFTALTGWWNSENKKRRHLWPGVATSRVSSKEDPGRPASEIINQINATRSLINRSVPGHIHWSFTPLKQNRSGVADLTRRQLYPTKSLVPASPWLGKTKLPAPTVRPTAATTFTWSPAQRGTRWWAVQTLSNGRWQHVATLPASQTSITLKSAPQGLAIHPVDYYGNSSKPGVLNKR